MDFYETNQEAVDALVKHYLDGALTRRAQILEPCCGDGAIVKALNAHGYMDILTSDVDEYREAQERHDARFHNWTGPHGISGPHVAVTNPPFNQAFDILKNLKPQVEAVALLLRLTFLEPTKERGPWLSKNPPQRVLVLPRYSFTGDGKTDSVTCAWMIWDKYFPGPEGVVIVPKKEKINETD